MQGQFWEGVGGTVPHKRRFSAVIQEQTCLHCGKKFRKHGKIKYCSHACAMRFAAEQRRRENKCRKCGGPNIRELKDQSPNICAACHRQRVNAKASRRRAVGAKDGRFQVLDDGTLTPQVTAKLFETAKECLYCGKVMKWEDKTRDHISPCKLGGWHSVYNIVICCRDCNNKKGTKQPMDWLLELPANRQMKVKKEWDHISGKMGWEHPWLIVERLEPMPIRIHLRSIKQKKPIKKKPVKMITISQKQVKLLKQSIDFYKMHGKEIPRRFLSKFPKAVVAAAMLA